MHPHIKQQLNQLLKSHGLQLHPKILGETNDHHSRHPDNSGSSGTSHSYSYSQSHNSSPEPIYHPAVAEHVQSNVNDIHENEIIDSKRPLQGIEKKADTLQNRDLHYIGEKVGEKVAKHIRHTARQIIPPILIGCIIG